MIKYRELIKLNKDIIEESLLSVYDPIDVWIEHFMNSPQLAGKPPDKIKQHALYAYMQAKQSNIPYITT